MLGTQLYTPYGGKLYQTGNMETNKGFTGQNSDSVTRWITTARATMTRWPASLSADSIQGDLAGMNPYGYVGGNPETQHRSERADDLVRRGLRWEWWWGSNGSGGNWRRKSVAAAMAEGEATEAEVAMATVGVGIGVCSARRSLCCAGTEQVAARAWEQWGTVVVPEAEESVEVAGGAAVTVVCSVVCMIVVAIGSVLLNPTPLASAQLPFPIIPGGPTPEIPKRSTPSSWAIVW